MRSKMLTLCAALILGAAALAVAPSASAQVYFRGTFPLPHGAISIGTGGPYYGYGYSGDYCPSYTYYSPGYSYYPSYYPTYTYVRPYYRRYRPYYRTYVRPHYYRSYRHYRRW